MGRLQKAIGSLVSSGLVIVATFVDIPQATQDAIVQAVAALTPLLVYALPNK